MSSDRVEGRAEAGRPLVLVTEGSAAAPLRWLKERADVEEVGPASPHFAQLLERADGLVVRTYTRVDETLLRRAPALRVVGRGGVGLENIDVPACRARGVEVVYTPDANTGAVAEFVIGLMLKLVRPWWDNALAPFTSEHFNRLRESAGEQLGELTLGILGMGRVGRALAGVAHGGFGMRVVYHDVVDVSGALVTPAESVSSVEELIRRCDVLSLHVDARPANRHLIDGATLRDGAFRWLINTSRGLVVDAAALDGALRQGRLRGVALDVFDPEPPLADSVYARLLATWPQRVLLTPHMASRTHRALENMSWVVRDVVNVLQRRPPQFPAP